MNKLNVIGMLKHLHATSKIMSQFAASGILRNSLPLDLMTVQVQLITYQITHLLNKSTGQNSFSNVHFHMATLVVIKADWS
jgi:cytochrome c oxidase subunit IV